MHSLALSDGCLQRLILCIKPSPCCSSPRMRATGAHIPVPLGVSILLPTRARRRPRGLRRGQRTRRHHCLARRLRHAEQLTQQQLAHSHNAHAAAVHTEKVYYCIPFQSC